MLYFLQSTKSALTYLKNQSIKLCKTIDFDLCVVEVNRISVSLENGHGEWQY